MEGLCQQTRLIAKSPLETSRTRPFKAGWRRTFGTSVSGGNELATYYLSATSEGEDGVSRLPSFEEDSVRALRGEVPDRQIRPNALGRLSVRANVGANVTRTSNLQASLGYNASTV